TLHPHYICQIWNFLLVDLFPLVRLSLQTFYSVHFDTTQQQIVETLPERYTMQGKQFLLEDSGPLIFGSVWKFFHFLSPHYQCIEIMEYLYLVIQKKYCLIDSLSFHCL